MLYCYDKKKSSELFIELNSLYIYKQTTVKLHKL